MVLLGVDVACCKDITNMNCCKNEHLVCTCMGVMYSEICQAIDEGKNSFQDLADEFMVGTGCSSCVPEIQDILQKKKNEG